MAEALVNLHRPYFVKALQARPDDPVRSEWGASFLVVIERSNVGGLYSIQPNSRH